MITSRRYTVGGFALALVIAQAAGAPVTLDTEQKAAAGVSTALFVRSEVPYFAFYLAENSRRHAEQGLLLLRGATTPEQLLASRAGVQINCSTSGTVTARISKAEPKVLRLHWNACAMNVLGYPRTYNGPVRIVLESATFEPQRVLELKLGDSTEDFTEVLRIETPEQIDDITNVRNIVVRGDISMERAYGGMGLIIGSSTYEMNGFMDDRTVVEYPDGRPAQALSAKVRAGKTVVIESVSIDQTGWIHDEEFQLLSGSLSLDRSDPPPYGTTTQAYKLNGLRVRNISDMNAQTNQYSIDGKVAITWNPFFGSGCMNGQYSFATRVPLSAPYNVDGLDSGTLAINGSVVARFYNSINVPRKLPTPVNGFLVNMRVDNVGTFNYDTSSLSEALRPLGQCN